MCNIFILRMSKKLEYFVYFGLSTFFLGCMIYTKYCLKDLQLKLFDATLVKHSQTSGKDLSARWIVVVNQALRKNLDVEFDHKALMDWVDDSNWFIDYLDSDYKFVYAHKNGDNSNNWKSNTLFALNMLVFSEKSFILGERK